MGQGYPVGAKRPTAGWQQRACANFVKNSNVWLFASCGLWVLKCSSGVVGLPCGGHMVSINEELKAAKAAKAAIEPLSKATPTARPDHSGS